jgi:hypothetical protein
MNHSFVNVVDDEPTPLGQYFRELASLLGAPPPRRVPVWLARLLAPYATAIAVDARLQVSNGKLRRDLGLEPAYPTYREGLKESPRPITGRPLQGRPDTRPPGWQPSRFLADRAEGERAFQPAERLGSVNAAAAEPTAPADFINPRSGRGWPMLADS